MLALIGGMGSVKKLVYVHYAIIFWRFAMPC